MGSKGKFFHQPKSMMSLKINGPNYLKCLNKELFQRQW